jgi:hypothetical protein
MSLMFLIRQPDGFLANHRVHEHETYAHDARFFRVTFSMPPESLAPDQRLVGGRARDPNRPPVAHRTLNVADGRRLQRPRPELAPRGSGPPRFGRCARCPVLPCVWQSHLLRPVDSPGTESASASSSGQLIRDPARDARRRRAPVRSPVQLHRVCTPAQQSCSR